MMDTKLHSAIISHWKPTDPQFQELLRTGKITEVTSITSYWRVIDQLTEHGGYLIYKGERYLARLTGKNKAGNRVSESGYSGSYTVKYRHILDTDIRVALLHEKRLSHHE